MTTLDDAVSLRIVRGNLDVVDAIAFGEELKTGKYRRPIVRDDLLDGSPSTKDVLENEVTNRLTRLAIEHSEFWVRREGATSVDDELETTRLRHVHNVNVAFAEDVEGDGDDRGNEELSGLTKLTLMTRLNIPLDVVLDHQPPKSFEKTSSNDEHPFVTKIVVSCANKFVST